MAKLLSCICLLLCVAVASAQKLMIPRGHTSAYQSIISADKKYLFTYDMHTVKVWETASNRLITDISEFKEDVQSVDYGNKAGVLFCLSGQELTGWNIFTGEQIVKITLAIGYNKIMVDDSAHKLVLFSYGFKILTINTDSYTQDNEFRYFKTTWASTHNVIPISSPRVLLDYTDTLYKFNYLTSQVEMKIPLREAGEAKKFIQPFYASGSKLWSYSDLRKCITVTDLSTGSELNTYPLNVDAVNEVQECGSNSIMIRNGYGERYILNKNTGGLSALKDKIEDKVKDYNNYGDFMSSKNYFVYANTSQDYYTARRTTSISIHDPNTFACIDTLVIPAPAHSSGSNILLGNILVLPFEKQSDVIMSNTTVYPQIIDLRYPTPPEEGKYESKAFASVVLSLLTDSTSPNKFLLQQPFNNYQCLSSASGIIFSKHCKYLFSQNYYQNKMLFKTVQRNGAIGADSVKGFGMVNTFLPYAGFSDDERTFAYILDSFVYVIQASNGALLSKKRIKQQYMVALALTGNEYMLVGSTYDSMMSFYSYAAKKWDSIKLPGQVVAFQQLSSAEFLITCSDVAVRFNASTKKINIVAGPSPSVLGHHGPGDQRVYLLQANGNVLGVDMQGKAPVTIYSDTTKRRKDVGSFWSNGQVAVYKHLQLSPSKKYLLANSGNTVNLWDAANQKLLFSAPGLPEVRNVSLLEDKGYLVVTGISHVWVFDFLNKQLVCSDSTVVEQARKHRPNVLNEHSMLNKLLLPDTVRDNQNKIYSISPYHFASATSNETGDKIVLTYLDISCVISLRPRLSIDWFYMHQYDTKLSKDGMELYGHDTRSVQRASFGDTTRVEKFVELENEINRIALAGKYLFVSCRGKSYSDKEGKILVYDRAIRSVVNDLPVPLKGSGYDVNAIVSPSGLYYVLCDEKTCSVYKTGNNTPIAVMNGDDHNSYFTNDDKYFIFRTGNDHDQIVNLSSGTITKENLEAYDAVYLGDGRFLGGGFITDIKARKKIYTGIKDAFALSQDTLIGMADGELAFKVLSSDKSTQTVAFQQPSAFTGAYLTPDRKFLLTTGNDKYLFKWHAATGTVAGYITVGRNYGRTLWFNTDSTFVVADNDDEATIYSIATLQPLYTIVPSSSGMLNYFLPQGYYYADKRDVKKYYFKKNGRLFDFSQYDIFFNRPDLVLRALHEPDTSLITLYEAARQKRLARAGITDTKSMQPGAGLPVITIDNRNELEAGTNNDNTLLKITAADEHVPVASIHVLVNDVPLFGTLGKKTNGGRSKISEVVSIPLSTGLNKIRVYATNAQGISSLSEQLFVTCSSKEKRSQPRTIFIGIGISTYKDTAMRLNFAAKDIRDLDAVLKQTMTGYSSHLLLDQAAIKDSILSLKTLLLHCGVEDKVVLAVCGHGLLNKQGDFYFATYDCSTDHPEKNGISYDALAWLLDSIPARKKLLLIDACQSGESDKSSQPVMAAAAPRYAGTTRGLGIRYTAGAQPTFKVMQDLFEEISSGNGTMIISAASSDQSAQEGGGIDNGWFTYSILKAIQEDAADANNDGKLSVSELRNYVNATVTKLSHGMQTPTTRQQPLDTDWYVK